jgi:hypothetical protein
MLRRAAVIAAGLAMATSFGLAGAGMAAAAAALKVRPSSHWTVEVTGGLCEVDTFNGDGSFATTEFRCDSGVWRGGASTLVMKWTHGNDKGEKFSGVFFTHPKEYAGNFTGIFDFGGPVVKGAVAGC